MSSYPALPDCLIKKMLIKHYVYYTENYFYTTYLIREDWSNVKPRVVRKKFVILNIVLISLYSRRIRSRWNAFTTIKDVLPAKLDKTSFSNLFNSTILQAKNGLPWRRKNRLVTAQRDIERFMLGISLREHFQSEVIWELSEGYDHKILKAKVLLGWTRRLFHKYEKVQLSSSI